MTPAAPDACLTCYGAGETVTENGPQACADCFGEGKAPSHGAAMEWRLRALEQAYVGSGREIEADILWLVHELRRSRGALLQILARCQDAEDSDATAREISYQAIEALKLYKTA
jgi:hypothetical protein